MRFILGCLLATVIGCGGSGSSRAEPEPTKKAAPPVNTPPSTAGRPNSPPTEGAPDTPPTGSLEILSVEPEGVIKAGDAKSPRSFQLKEAELGKLLEVGEWVLPAQDGSTVKALLHFSYKAGKGAPETGLVPGFERFTGKKWTSTPGPGLKGRTGRIVIEFPGKDKGRNTRFDVLRGDESADGDYGSKACELMPGAYKVVVGGKALLDVPVAAQQETRVHVGLLKLELAEKGTRWDVYDEDGKTLINGGYGSYELGLPAGPYLMEIHKVRVPVTIEAGKITDF